MDEAAIPTISALYPGLIGRKMLKLEDEPDRGSHRACSIIRGSEYEEYEATIVWKQMDGRFCVLDSHCLT